MTQEQINAYLENHVGTPRSWLEGPPVLDGEPAPDGTAEAPSVRAVPRTREA